MSSTMFNKPLDTEFVGKVNELSEQIGKQYEWIYTPSDASPKQVNISNYKEFYIMLILDNAVYIPFTIPYGCLEYVKYRFAFSNSVYADVIFASSSLAVSTVYSGYSSLACWIKAR